MFLSGLAVFVCSFLPRTGNYLKSIFPASDRGKAESDYGQIPFWTLSPPQVPYSVLWESRRHSSTLWPESPWELCHCWAVRNTREKPSHSAPIPGAGWEKTLKTYKLTCHARPYKDRSVEGAVREDLGMRETLWTRLWKRRRMWFGWSGMKTFGEETSWMLEWMWWTYPTWDHLLIIQTNVYWTPVPQTSF